MPESSLASDERRDLTPALAQALRLFATPRPELMDASHGYLDLLGRQDPAGRSIARRLIGLRTIPPVYQHFWRPLTRRMLMGWTGPHSEDEHRIALSMLSLAPSDRVLDVACGPGSFTRNFAQAASYGLVVGIDASARMLDVAVRETAESNVAYLRGDAAALPFDDHSFDGVCCFAALYPIKKPMRAVEEIIRVLAPGGRLALMTSCERTFLPAYPTHAIVRRASGMRVFGRNELTRALAERGLIDIEQRVTGFAQFVGARKPD